MIILERLEAEAEHAGQRHLVLVEALFGAKEREMSDPAALSPASVERLKREMETLALAHLEGETALLEDIISAFTRNAHRDALDHLGIETAQNDADAPSDALRASESTSGAYLGSELIAQLSRDVSQVLREYRNAAYRAEILKMTRGLSHQAAVMEIAIDDLMQRRRVWFSDRAGRRIPSQKFIRRIWRQVLRDHYVRVYAMALAERGETEAILWHPDPNHGAFGTVLYLEDPNFGLDDIDSVLHPNAHALPVARTYFLESVA